jgi:hypothetical protein
VQIKDAARKSRFRVFAGAVWHELVGREHAVRVQLQCGESAQKFSRIVLAATMPAVMQPNP